MKVMSDAGGDGEAPDREDDGADAPEAVAPAPANPPPAAPAPGNPPAPGNGGRRRLPLLDLDALKQDRANLKRQLRECAKNVKGQARRA